MVTPRTETERAVFEVWKELRPDEAFVFGLDECAGRLFIPTQRRVDSLLAKISRIRKSATSPIERKLLASFGASLELREPARLPQTLLESLFGYMIKEGVKANHMRTLATDGRKALDATRRRVRGPTAPGMRALVQLACSGLDEILKVVEGELRNKDARAAVQALVAANARYAKAFDLPGFSPAGTFDETYGLFKRAGCGLGRARSYPRALRDLWDYTQTPAQVEAAGLRMLRRELRVVPEIPEGAWIRSGSAESASGPFEQRVGLVERSRGGEAWEAERLRVPRVRGDERLDGGPCILVAELAFHDLQDLIEATARELDKRPHARSGRTAHPPAGRVEGLPAIGGKSAHVIRLDALFDHVAEEGFEQRLREAGRFSQLEARAVRSEEFPLDWVLRRLLDSRNPGQDRLHPRLGRDEQVAGAFVDTEHERLVRPQLLPEVEHRPLGLGPRRQHSTVVIAGRQLRMRPTRRYGSRNGEYAVHSVFVCADDRSSGACLGGIGGRDRVAHSNLPSDKDLGAKPSPMNQPGEHASSRQAFEVGARLAQTDAAEPNVAHEKLPADEMVQRRSPRDDVPPRLARCDRKLAIAGHRLDCFGFDQGDLPPRPGPVGVRARRSEVPVALEAFPLDRADGLHGLHRVLRLRREVDRDDLAVPRGPAGHRAANCVGDLTIAYPGAARIASASISTRTCGSINRLTWSKVAAGRICWKNSACARPTFSQSSMFVTNMRVRITSSSWAPASARAASIVRKMWTAWPYASPGATTFPSGSVAVVPATATWLPMRTTREYPTIGSQG